MPALSPVHHPLEPADSPLWKVLHQHYAAFKSGYDEYYGKQYGFFRPVVDEVVFVFSIPKMLRIYFKYDRKLLTQLCQCANEGLQIFFRTVLGLADGILGMIMVIHTSEKTHNFMGVPHFRRCPRCGHELKIISLIHELDVIERILRHLGLWKQPPDPHEGKIKGPEDGPVVLYDCDDGWPGYEEPVLVCN
jgi:hypothetical protein